MYRIVKNMIKGLILVACFNSVTNDSVVRAHYIHLIPGAFNIEEYKKDYTEVADRVYLKNGIAVNEVDITKIPRYSIAYNVSQDYIKAIEGYFGSENPTMVLEDLAPDNSLLLTKNMENEKGSYTLNTKYSHRYNTFIAIIDYYQKQDLMTTAIVNNLLNYPLFYEDIELSDDHLSFGTKDEASHLIEDFVKKVVNFPSIKINQIKALSAEQLQRYVDNENLNQLKENQEDWLVEPRDVYLIDFSMVLEGITVSNKNALTFDLKNEIQGMIGEAIVSKNGIESIALQFVFQPDKQLSPLESVITIEEVYNAVSDYMNHQAMGAVEEKEWFINDLKVVYLPYFIGNQEMAFSPVWQATVEYLWRYSEENNNHEQLITEEVFIDPVTGRDLSGKGA